MSHKKREPKKLNESKVLEKLIIHKIAEQNEGEARSSSERECKSQKIQ